MGAAPQSACQCGESPNASEDVVAAEEPRLESRTGFEPGLRW